MNTQIAPQRNRRGVVLLEVIMAVSFFSVAAVGFVVALNEIAKVSIVASEKVKIERILNSEMNRILSRPVLLEGEEFTSPPDMESEAQLEIQTVVEPLELENQDGQTLAQMFRIIVRATWREDGKWQEEEIETWRYRQLYSER